MPQYQKEQKRTKIKVTIGLKNRVSFTENNLKPNFVGTFFMFFFLKSSTVSN